LTAIVIPLPNAGVAALRNWQSREIDVIFAEYKPKQEALMELIRIRGRGAPENPANRFEQIQYEPDPEAREEDEPAPRTQFFRDTTRRIIATNESPDVGFTHSVNPYRGCEHGCIYCFARPFHEYLGLSAGLDFETKIFVKDGAAELLRRELSARSWQPTPIAMSGVTDPYQPVERRLRITRGCLEVLAEFRNPVGIVTKNHLVTRDADLLGDLAGHGAAAVHISLTTLDEKLQRVMEPRTSSPARRLAAVRSLSEAGVPVGVLLAPIVPGLTDHEIPALLEAAAAAGATSAGFIPLRLPHAVAGMFERWLETHFPDRKEKVLGRIREIRGGDLYDSRYGVRMRGEGVYADHMRALFQTSRRRHGLDFERRPLSTASFRVPAAGGQMALFD
jgi:DNA repair photolyase